MEPGVRALHDRVLAARERLRAAPVSTSTTLSPPDPKTGERWDRYNVLGHTAELLTFWSKEISEAIATGRTFGRRPESSSRVEGIEGGRTLGEPQLRERIESGSEILLSFIATLRDSDLEKEIVHNRRGPMPVSQAFQDFLVGHFEEHCSQLADLG